MVYWKKPAQIHYNIKRDARQQQKGQKKYRMQKESEIITAIYSSQGNERNGEKRVCVREREKK